MADLFTCKLTPLSFQDVDEFLGLSLPEDKRLPESSQIDYKQDLPGDLGDDVAALANTYGGLIFLGIKSDKNRNNVPVQWDGVHLGSDPSVRVSSRILSTVRPRPEFDIGLVGSTNGSIVIVRVKEGSYPPYEYEQGASVRIPIRVNDRNKQASVRDIEALIERRNATKQAAQRAITSLQPESLVSFRTESLPGGGTRDSRDDRVHRMVLVPHRPTRWRLDVKFERQFERWIQGTFPNVRTFSSNFRSGMFYEVREIRYEAKRLYRVWRITSDGALGVARNVDHHGFPGEPIGDIAVDLLFFFRLARVVLEAGASFGRSLFTDVLSSPSTSYLPKFPTPNGLHGYDEIKGVHFPATRPEVLPGTTTWAEELDFHVVEDPVDMSTQVLFDQLRSSWGASIDYDRLLEAVAALDAQSRTANWGRI
jgi:hypothetical protein